MKSELVSIVLVCHNQKQYVEEAIRSVWSQTYDNIELIIVDDASTDGSSERIGELIAEKQVVFLPLDKNVGNCKAFNTGFAKTNGEFVIDLAADDVLHSDKVEKQVSRFRDLSKEYGVVYTDANLVDEQGASIGTQVDKVRRIGKLRSMPSGDVFKELLQNFFIASPTQMIRRKVFEDVGLYDEDLAYEDFDFWIRSSRHWKFDYLDEPLMTIRKLPSSMSAKMYHPGDPKVASTLEVCRKALNLVQTDEEMDALKTRARYEFRMAWKYKNHEMKPQWYRFMVEIGASNFLYWLMAKL